VSGRNFGLENGIKKDDRFDEALGTPVPVTPDTEELAKIFSNAA